MSLMNKIFIGMAATFALLANATAQSYSIDWHKVSGGRGTSTSGVYSVSGTIGQANSRGANFVHHVLESPGHCVVAGVRDGLDTPNQPECPCGHLG